MLFRMRTSRGQHGALIQFPLKELTGQREKKVQMEDSFNY